MTPPCDLVHIHTCTTPYPRSSLALGLAEVSCSFHSTSRCTARPHERHERVAGMRNPRSKAESTVASSFTILTSVERAPRVLQHFGRVVAGYIDVYRTLKVRFCSREHRIRGQNRQPHFPPPGILALCRALVPRPCLLILGMPVTFGHGGLNVDYTPRCGTCKSEIKPARLFRRHEEGWPLEYTEWTRRLLMHIPCAASAETDWETSQ